jgi:coenzyme PQQ precursor peptide PqqA
MAKGLCRSGPPRDDAARDGWTIPAPPAGDVPTPTFPGDLTMQWQTPTATDLRFGFEITMYVAAR